MPQPEIRVLQTGNDWFGERPGGLNRFYGELLRHLPEVNVRVRGLVAGSPRVWHDSGQTVSAFAPVTAPLPWRMLQARRVAGALIEEFQPDLVASHFALYAAPILDKVRDLPFVVHFHGPWAAEAGLEGQTSRMARMQAALETAVYRRGRGIIVLSEAFKQELVRRYHVAEERVVIVPGGIDPEIFHDRLSRQEARGRLGWPIDRPIVLAVRRQMRRMGLENLVDSIVDVKRRVPEVLVMLAGSGPLVGELRDRILAHGLSENIRQLGRVDDADLPASYRAADLSIVPTQALEGFGMITLESLASGTPVLVTPVGGLPEVLRPFAPECILPDASTQAISEALIDFLLGMRTLPSSEACRAYAETHYAWPVIVAKTRRVYDEAMR